MPLPARGPAAAGNSPSQQGSLVLFNSFPFIGYFALVAVVYWLAPHRWRWVLLLIASYYFYSTYEPRYLILLGAATLVAYGAALYVPGRQRTTAGRVVLTAGVAAELLVLAVFKYFNFFSESAEGVLNDLGGFSEAITLPRLDFLLPAGLSFYVFSSISYIVDVYREEIPAERHLGKVAVYISFFPKLLAGPIERAGPFLANLSKPIAFSGTIAVAGLQLILWGLFKKVVIADRLAEFVNTGFTNPDFQSPLNVIIAVYFYAFQIYCDFSGYSDIAIGCALVLGIQLMENFRRPYFAKSIPEFWSGRWHISLMAWFRNYLYIPLGGNRVSRLRWYGNQMIIFLTSGLWHGSNWTFVVWGGLNGAYQVVYFMVVGERKADPVELRGRVARTAAVTLLVAAIFAALYFTLPDGYAGVVGGSLPVELLAAVFALAGALTIADRLPIGAVFLAAAILMVVAFGFHIFFGTAIVIAGFALIFGLSLGRPSRFFPEWLWTLLSILFTFHAILFAWIFFRANSLGQAFSVIGRIWAGIPQLPTLISAYNFTTEFWLSVGLIVFLLLVEAVDEYRGFWKWLMARSTPVRWSFYYVLMAALVVIGQWGVAEFVYMQF
jgi:D-alanyl-lipoteichoic acid acyltransferase DltB (MBOAT superfamily)